jgi:predicted DNA-binding transcriptional regulator AlpA
LNNSTILLTPKEAAERLRGSESTLAKWRLTGFGPSYVKIGSKVRYETGAIDAWLASRVRRSTSDTGKAA